MLPASSDLAGGNRRRIRADLAAARGKPPVDFTADDCRPQTNAQRIGSELKTGEIFTDENQYAVGNRLAGKAGAGGAEREVGILPASHGQYVRYVVFIFGDPHNPGYQPVKTGISTPGQTTEFVGNDALCRETSAKIRNKCVQAPTTPLTYRQMITVFMQRTPANLAIANSLHQLGLTEKIIIKDTMLRKLVAPK